MCDHGERATLFNQKHDVKIRKVHKCSSCGFVMEVGYKAWRIDMLYDGAWSTYRFCNHCEAVSDMLQESEYTDGCIYPDNLLNDFDENSGEYRDFYVELGSVEADAMKEEFYERVAA